LVYWVNCGDNNLGAITCFLHSICGILYYQSILRYNKSDLCNVSVIFFCFVVNFPIVHVFFRLVTFWTISAGSTALPWVSSTRSALEINLVPWFSTIIYSFRSVWRKMRSASHEGFLGGRSVGISTFFCSDL